MERQPGDGGLRPLRVVLIEDDEDVRNLLEVMLELDERFDLVAQAGDGRQGLELAKRLRPDAVVVDLELPELDGLEAIPLLRREVPGAAIVVFSAFPDPYTLGDVLRLGATTYVDKGAAWAELFPAILSACSAEATAGPASAG